MFQPIYQPLNDAVMRITARLLPDGFDVSDVAPNTLDELNACMERGRLVVWSMLIRSTPTHT